MLAYGLIPLGALIVLIVTAALRRRWPFWMALAVSALVTLNIFNDVRSVFGGQTTEQSLGQGIAVEIVQFLLFALTIGTTVRAVILWVRQQPRESAVTLLVALISMTLAIASLIMPA